MAKEICISSTPHETRLAILEDDQLAEIYYERENEYTLAGSIYNGRVTRVLPGMQSAFVDVGLERDAFLYVTDFLELEDQEETDELEKAAATGGNQPPREVRHSAAPDNRGGRSVQKPEPKPEPRPAQDRPASERPSPERSIKERRLLIESGPEADEATVPESTFDSEQAGAGPADSGEPGAKRWRGRRRRRGGRGAAGSHEGQAEAGDTPRVSLEGIPETEPEVAPEIHAAGVPTDRSTSVGWSAGVPTDRSSSAGFAEPAPRFERASAASPTPFVLPGESLSKYGGAPAESAPAEDATRPAIEPAAPVRPASAFKPATLIESPIEWDGSGLLPGESLSRHVSRQDRAGEPAPEAQSEPREVSSDAPEIDGGAPDAVEEQDFFEEISESGPESAQTASPNPAVESTLEPRAPVS
jgi:ribonuclease G